MHTCRPSEIELWVGNGKGGMESELRANSNSTVLIIETAPGRSCSATRA